MGSRTLSSGKRPMLKRRPILREKDKLNLEVVEYGKIKGLFYGLSHDE